MAAKSRAHVYVNSKAVERAKERLEERGQEAQPRRVTVGIHQNDASQPKIDYDGKDSGATLGQVATAHEFGINVPERSWLRTWFDQNRARIIHEMVDAMREEYEGKGGAIEKQGAEWSRELQEWIEYQDGHLKALQPSTVASKQRANLSSPETPLFATGQLVAAIKSIMEFES